MANQVVLEFQIRRSEMPLRGYLAGVACGRLSRETTDPVSVLRCLALATFR